MEDLDFELPPVTMGMWHDEASANAIAFYGAAFEARENGDNLVCVERAFLGVARAEHPWVFTRFFVFLLGCLTVRQKILILEKKQKKFLKDIMRNEKEPTVFRVEAAITLATSAKKVGEPGDKIAGFYRLALELIHHATEEERSKRFMYQGDFSDSPGKSCGEILDYGKSRAELNLSNMQTGTTDPRLFANLEASTQQLGLGKQRMTLIFPRGLVIGVDNSLEERLFQAGGAHCDHCKKSKEEAGVLQLEVCARCQLAYYCSKGCQKKQWKAGHKGACREKGHIVAGDFMILAGLENKTELNGHAVRVVEQKSSDESKWTVELVTGDKRRCCVPGKKLRRIRPEK